MNPVYHPQNAINFLKKGFALSLLIFSSVTTYSNPPIEKNMAGKADYNFLTEKPAAPLPNSKREDFYSYAENTAMSSKTDPITRADKTYTGALPPPPASDEYEPNETSGTARLLTATFAATANKSTVSITAATIHTPTDVDFYKINLETGYAYAINVVLNDTDNNQANNSNYTLNVKISYSTNGSTWSNPTDNLPSLNEQGGKILYLKIEPATAQATGTYAAGITLCTYSLSSVTKQADANRGAGGVTVTASALCPIWTVELSANANWITISSGLNGAASREVRYNYNENMSTGSREGTMTIAGNTFTIYQAGRPLAADIYEGINGNNNNTPETAHILPATFSATVNTRSVSITAATIHTPTDEDYYKINLATGFNYTISWVLYDTENQNNNSNYTLNAKISYSTNGSPWSPATDNQTIPNAQGGYLYLKIEPATAEALGSYGAKITLTRGPSGCSYTLSAENKPALKEEGQNQVTVTASTPCTASWTASPNANWIMITSGASGAGSRDVGYAYNANMDPAQRTGTITIADKTFSIIQEGRPLEADIYEGGGDNRNDTQATAHELQATFPANENTLDVPISAASFHTTADVDYYKINLPTGYTYSINGVLHDRDNNDALKNNYTLLNVKISSSTNGSTWSPAADNLAILNAQEGYLYLKIESATAQATGTYGATITLTRTAAAAGSCNYTLTLGPTPVTMGTGRDQVLVVPGASCPAASAWEATTTTTSNWITLTSGHQSATGSRNVGYDYNANMAPEPRTGSITIAGQSFPIINQPGRPLGPDGYEVNETQATAHVLPATFPANGNTLNVPISAASFHTTADVDYYKINLPTGYTYTINGVLLDRDNNDALKNNYTLLNVKISSSTNGSTNGSTWSPAADNLAILNAQEGYLYLKIEPATAQATGTYGATITLTRTAVPPCTYTVTPVTSVTPVTTLPTMEAGSAQVLVVPGASCPAASAWEATTTTTSNWITLTSGHQSATGSRNVGYDYNANMAPEPRTGSITIAGQPFPIINQPGRPLGPDSYEVNETQATAHVLPATFPATVNTTNVSISPATCYPTGDVDYYQINLEANFNYTLSGALYDNNQTDGSNYTLDAKISYSIDSINWINVPGRQLSDIPVQGGEIIYLKIEPNTTGSTGTYAASITLNRTPGCTQNLTPKRKKANVEGGPGQVEVAASALCASTWTASSTTSWITLPPGQSGTTGLGTVNYTYKPNMAPGTREGTITIAGKTISIIQDGRPLAPDGYEPNNTVAAITANPNSNSTFTPTFNSNNAAVVSISPATCYPAGDVDYYQINLEANFNYTLSGALNDHNNQTEGSNYTLDAKISYSIDNLTWSNVPGRQLSDIPVNGGEILYLKIEPNTTGGTGTYAASIILTRSPACTYTLFPRGKQATTAEAGDGHIVVTASALCTTPWTASSPDYWIAFPPAQSATTGSGSVNYTYKPNMAPDIREGKIFIDNKTFTINQPARPLAPDDYEPNNTVAEITNKATFTPTFNSNNAAVVSISAASCYPTGDIDFYKIILEPGYHYSISRVLYDTENNTFHKNNYTLHVISYAADHNSSWSYWGGGTGNALIGVHGGEPFYFKIQPNTTGQTGTYGAEITLFRQAACTYSLSPRNRELNKEAGSSEVNVILGGSCTSAWSATSQSPWITLTAGHTPAAIGSRSVSYEYQANMGPTDRIGKISIAGREYALTQKGHTPPEDTYEPNNTVEAITAGSRSILTPVFTGNEATLPILAATCHNSNDIDIYKIILAPDHNYTISGVLKDRDYNAANQTNYTLNARASFSTDSTNWSSWGENSLPPKSFPGGETLYLKIEPVVAGNTGSYEVSLNLTQVAGCTWLLSSKSKQVSAAAGDARVRVTAGTSCATTPLTANPNATWITVTSGQNATGPGYVDVGYHYMANITAFSREGTITIAGQPYKVVQQGLVLPLDNYEPNNTVDQTTANPNSIFTPVFTNNVATLPISPANCHDNNDIDIYKINLEAGYSYTLSGMLHDAGTNTANTAHYTLRVRAFYSTNGTNWSNWSSGLVGQLTNQTVQGVANFYFKTQPFPPGSIGTYAAQININKTSTTGCTYQLQQGTSQEVTWEAGTNQQITVTTNSSGTVPCVWSATSPESWITLTVPGGTNSGYLVFAYPANTTMSSRTVTITIAGQPFRVTQTIQPDAYEGNTGNNTQVLSHSITPTFTNQASTVSISPANCHNASDVDYYKINLDEQYVYTVTGKINDKNNQIAGSNYTLAAKVSWSTDSVTWSTAARQLPNLTVVGGFLYLKIEPNIAGNIGSYAAGLDIKKTTTVGCTYILSPPSREIFSTLISSQEVSVTTGGPTCIWSATSHANWIQLVSGQSSNGSGTLVYSCTANTGLSSRTGTITIAGQTYKLTQLPSALTPDRYEGDHGNNTPGKARLLSANAGIIAISPANCHQVEDVDIYKINLEANYSYTFHGDLHDKFNPDGGRSYTLEVKGFYSTDEGLTWIVWGDSQLPYTTVPGGKTLYIKIVPAQEGYTGTYAARINITRVAACTYNLPAGSKEVTAEGGNELITVTASALCTSRWTATVAMGADWLSLTSGQEGATVSGSVGYAYSKNTTGFSRTGTLTIANLTYTVTQLPATLTPDGYEGNNGNNTAAQAWLFTPVFTDNASTTSISPTNCHHNRDIDIYKINLNTAYSYSLSGELFDTDNNTNSYTLNVKSSYSTDGVTWIAWGDRQLSNPKVSGSALYLKIEPSLAGRIGTYAARIDLKIEATVACAYRLPVTRLKVNANEGNNRSVQVTATSATAGETCPRTATSHANWITLTSGQSGTGTDSVGYSYRANRSPDSRTGTITIAGLTYTLTQAGSPLGPDGYEPNNTVDQAWQLPTSYDQNVSTLSISAGCHTVEDVDFYKITLDNGFTYSVSTELDEAGHSINFSNYTLDAKLLYSTDGLTWSDRIDIQFSNLSMQSGTLYLKIDSFHKNDDTAEGDRRLGTYGAKIVIRKMATTGCTYTLTVPEKEVTWEAATAQAEVTTGSSANLTCIRTAISNVPWIRLTSGQSEEGTGNVGYSYEANTSAESRTGTITIADKTYMVTQGIQPDGYEDNNTVAQAHSFTPEFTENTGTLSISPANCHKSDDVDYYKIILAAGYSYTVNGTLYDRRHRPDNSNYTLDAAISYSTNGSNWSLATDAQLPTMTVPDGALYFKIEPLTAGAMGSYAVRIELRKAGTTGCTYNLSPSLLEVSATAGDKSINVEAIGEACNRIATPHAGWIRIKSGDNATGSGVVEYSYQANTEWSSRTGTITIAGSTYTLTQLPPPLPADGYEDNDTMDKARALSATFTENKSTVSISQANCHLIADVDFYKIELEADYHYTLSGTLYGKDNQTDGSSYTLNAESYYSTNGTTWTSWGTRQLSSLSSVQGGEAFYVKIVPFQAGKVGTYAAKIELERVAGCTFNLLPKSQTVAAEAGNSTVTVAASPLCTSSWDATTPENWIIPDSGHTGTIGSGAVAYHYLANELWSTRTGKIIIAGKDYMVTQSPRSLQPDKYEGTTGNNTVAQAHLLTPVFTQNASTLSIEPANCHQVEDVDFYKITLNVGHSYAINVVLNERAEGATDSYTLDAKISYSTNGTVWSPTENERLLIPVVPGGTLYLKIVPRTSGKVGTYAAKINISVTGGCNTYRLSAANKSVAPEKGSASVNVTAGTLCVWTAESKSDWIKLTAGQNSTGPGRVSYEYDANMVAERRTGTITVAGHTYTVNQAAAPACTFNLTSKDANVPAETGKGLVPVDALRNNCEWTASSNVDWIVITPGQTITGDGSVEYTYTENTVIEPRTGTLTVAGETYTVTQAEASACTINLTSSEAGAEKAEGKGSISITTSRSNCTWRASSYVDWITITSDRNGTGEGKVDYTYTENKTSGTRTGKITIADKTFTLTQSLVTGIEPAGHVNIFPNPAGDFVTVDLSAAGIKYVSLKIINQFGQILYELGSPAQTLQIPLKGFANGLYFIQIQGEEKVWREKLMINH